MSDNDKKPPEPIVRPVEGAEVEFEELISKLSAEAARLGLRGIALFLPPVPAPKRTMTTLLGDMPEDPEKYLATLVQMLKLAIGHFDADLSGIEPQYDEIIRQMKEAQKQGVH